MCCFCAGHRNSGYKCVHVSDPQSKRWLADDPHFLASLNDLDQGLLDIERADADADEAFAPDAVAAVIRQPAPPEPAPPAPPDAIAPAAVAIPRAARPIN